MGKSKKGGLIARRRSALERLEATYEKFKEAKKDKEPWVSTRNGVKHTHPGRSYAAECKRLSEEIAALKARIH